MAKLPAELVMTKILAISEEISTFGQVEGKLGLTLAEDSQFFTEWMDGYSV